MVIQSPNHCLKAAELLRGDSLLLTIKLPRVPCTYLVLLRRKARSVLWPQRSFKTRTPGLIIQSSNRWNIAPQTLKGQSIFSKATVYLVTTFKDIDSKKIPKHSRVAIVETNSSSESCKTAKTHWNKAIKSGRNSPLDIAQPIPQSIKHIVISGYLLLIDCTNLNPKIGKMTTKMF